MIFTWWMWVILGLLWLLTLYATYVLAIKKVTTLAFRELSKSFEESRKHSLNWTKVNNRYVRDVANMVLDDDAILQQKYLKILAKNRKLSCSNKILAKKYKIATQEIKKKPQKNRLEDMSLLITYVYEQMRRYK